MLRKEYWNKERPIETLSLNEVDSKQAEFGSYWDNYPKWAFLVKSFLHLGKFGYIISRLKITIKFFGTWETAVFISTKNLGRSQCTKQKQNEMDKSTTGKEQNGDFTVTW